MSRRSILQVSTKKKRDNMPCLRVLGDRDGPTDTVGTPANMTGERVWFYGFVPTARAVRSNHNQPAGENRARKGDYARESAYTYSVGYSERINFETGGAANWKWRRIVISSQRDLWYSFAEDTLEYYDERSVPHPAQVRTMYDFAQNVFVQQSVCELLFEGQQGVDWADLFNAKLDRSRLRVIYDKVRTISGGNDAAHWGSAKHWYPHKESLVYENKESGDSKFNTGNSAKFVAESGRTGGNMYIFDIFACANGAESNQMRWSPTGTYYWHER